MIVSTPEMIFLVLGSFVAFERRLHKDQHLLEAFTSYCKRLMKQKDLHL